MTRKGKLLQNIKTLANAEYHEDFIYRESNYRVITRIVAEPAVASFCITDYEGNFYLLDVDIGIEVQIGSVNGHTVDKERLRPTTRRKAQQEPDPAWCQELLTRPVGYLADPTLHSDGSADDDMTDMQKTFQLLFDSKGQVKSNVMDHAPLLEAGSKIHYVHYYCLKKEFRGSQGFGQIAMLGYLEGLKSVSDGLAFEGTVILPAAPLANEWRSEVKPGQETRLWNPKQESLKRSYNKTGFTNIHDGDPDIENSISVLGIYTYDLDHFAPPTGSPIALPPAAASPVDVAEPSASPTTSNQTVDTTSTAPSASLIDETAVTLVSRQPESTPSETHDESDSEGWTSSTRSGNTRRTIVVPSAVRGLVPASEVAHLRDENDTIGTFTLPQHGARYPWRPGRKGGFIIYHFGPGDDPQWYKDGWADFDAREVRRQEGAKKAAQANAGTKWTTRQYVPHPCYGAKKEWHVEEIIDETEQEYRVTWKETRHDGRRYRSSWQPKDEIVDDAVLEAWAQKTVMDRESDEDWNDDD